MFYFKVAAVWLVGLSVLATGGCATDKAVISQAQDVHQGLAPAVMSDPQLSGYIQAVGDRVIDTAKELDRQQYGPDSHRSEQSDWMFSNKMQFHLVNSKTLNAFTTGGEHMYIYSALFEQCQSEDELAAVVAHEYGHVYGRHVQKGMNRQKVMLGVAVGAGAAGYVAGGSDKGGEYAGMFGTAALAASQFIGMGYTRKDENEADKLGFTFYTHAGWEPKHFADFFQHMIDLGLDTTPQMLSDHPSLKSRVEQVKQWVKELPPSAAQWRRPPVADAARFAALKQHSAVVSKQTPSDQSLAKAQQLLAAFPSCVSPVETQQRKQAQAEVLAAAQKEQERKK